MVLWAALDRQVRVVGHATAVTDDEADAFFAARPRAANLAAQVARQDEVIAGPDVLERRLRELAALSRAAPSAARRAGVGTSSPRTPSSSGRAARITSTTGCAIGEAAPAGASSGWLRDNTRFLTRTTYSAGSRT